MQFKQSFLDRYEKLTDIEKFKEYSIKKKRKAVRVNTLKISAKEIKERLKEFNLKQIPWCEEGFFIEGYEIGNLKEHFLGYIYIQDAASMIPANVLEPKGVVLDLAASPGSKTTQISALMKNEGIIVANDNELKRVIILEQNLQRCGCLNTIISLKNGLAFKEPVFDRVLLDAPCSGTGIIRKSLETLKTYNTEMIKKISNLQKKLMLSAFDSLKEGGKLVYSTCSLEPEENEEVVDFLIRNRDAKVEKINVDIKRGNAIEEFEGKSYSSEVKKCLRIWPQDNDTEGFFVAKICK